MWNKYLNNNINNTNIWEGIYIFDNGYGYMYYIEYPLVPSIPPLLPPPQVYFGACMTFGNFGKTLAIGNACISGSISIGNFINIYRNITSPPVHATPNTQTPYYWEFMHQYGEAYTYFSLLL